MTDHLDAAQRWLSTAQDSRSFDHLMSAMDQIIAHLEAQNARSAHERTNTMTDHLTEARAFAAGASQAPDAGGAISWLTATCAAIIAHLEAQQTSQQPATAPPAAQQGDSGHRDGGEAERAAEGYPAEAVRAVSAALHLDACTDDAHDGCDTGDWTREAETAIAAAEPHIRAKIAAEIEQHYLGADYGRNPATGADSPDARLHEAYDEALSLAARIARGEQS